MKIYDRDKFAARLLALGFAACGLALVLLPAFTHIPSTMDVLACWLFGSVSLFVAGVLAMYKTKRGWH